MNDCNYGRFLGDVIDYAQAQEYPDIEVIVVDDGSLMTWSSVAFVLRFAA